MVQDPELGEHGQGPHHKGRDHNEEQLRKSQIAQQLLQVQNQTLPVTGSEGAGGTTRKGATRARSSRASTPIIPTASTSSTPGTQDPPWIRPVHGPEASRQDHQAGEELLHVRVGRADLGRRQDEAERPARRETSPTRSVPRYESPREGHSQQGQGGRNAEEANQRLYIGVGLLRCDAGPRKTPATATHTSAKHRLLELHGLRATGRRGDNDYMHDERRGETTSGRGAQRPGLHVHHLRHCGGHRARQRQAARQRGDEPGPRRQLLPAGLPLQGFDVRRLDTPPSRLPRCKKHGEDTNYSCTQIYPTPIIWVGISHMLHYQVEAHGSRLRRHLPESTSTSMTRGTAASAPPPTRPSHSRRPGGGGDSLAAAPRGGVDYLASTAATSTTWPATRTPRRRHPYYGSHSTSRKLGSNLHHPPPTPARRART